MSRKSEIIEETYLAYGFKRQELTDFLHSKGKNVNFGLPPMNFDDVGDVSETVTTSLGDALEEIEKLKKRIDALKSCLPNLLDKYREDDPLKIAIQLRNDEWANYDPEDRKTIPSQEALVTQIKQQYKSFDMPDVQARAIEKVACPIKRK
ncbi:hypothetical protein I5520_08225 [Citrobacter sp. FDAARGOS_156]|uniref:hypothetical protein n=1 Tax=Citrobacter sp. FDAARGOS_156 TaxID=1702170 RepID=UPI0019068766|nr:hypothetical protein [Citrobacter sp. FDAARGOS_156]MBJ9641972.1 hypothetical protein [Citrobacter sp. FDAARGOS_156]